MQKAEEIGKRSKGNVSDMLGFKATETTGELGKTKVAGIAGFATKGHAGKYEMNRGIGVTAAPGTTHFTETGIIVRY